jgi:hypothetical protein
LYFAYRHVRLYHAKIQEKFSNTEKVNLNWLVLMLGSFGIILLVSLVSTFIPLTRLGAYLKVGVVVVIVFILVFVTAIIWRAMKRGKPFSGVEEKPEKYSGSNLLPAERQNALEKLDHVMRKEKYFREPDITLDVLAQKVGTTPKSCLKSSTKIFAKTFLTLSIPIALRKPND